MMRILAALALCLALPVHAQEIASADGDATATDGAELSVIERWQADPVQMFQASEVRLDELLFLARPVIVFADNPNDPRFREQVALLEERLGELAARDAIVLLDADPAAGSDARARLRPRGFVLVLIGKDGLIAQRKPAPWSVREIGRAIDKLPLRQQEIRDGV